MGFFDRLGNVARGAVRVESQAWADGGGLEGQLDRLSEGLRAAVQGERRPAASAAGEASAPLGEPHPDLPGQGSPGASPRAAAGDPTAPNPDAAVLAALDADLAAGRITQGEWSRRRAELRRARHGRRL